MSGAAAARQSPEQPPDDDLGRMSFLDHLDELRTRIIHATLGVAAGLVLAGAFIKPILDFIIAPLDALLPQSSFFISTLFGLGLVFQMPTIAFFLAKMGVVTAKMLLRGFKYAVLASVVVGAIVTPSPDAWAQLVIAGTMMALYVVCIGIVALVAKKAPRRASAAILVFPAGYWLWRRRRAPATWHRRRSAW